MSNHYDVILVVLPWASILSPSIQVGLLKGVLDREGISTRTAHLNVEFFKFLQDKAISTSIRTIAAFHDNLKDVSTVSPWIFAVPPVFTDNTAVNAYFERIKQSMTGKDLESVELVMQLRELVPLFFEQCLEEILEFQPKLVGFSCTFDQRTPSLVLAMMLKQKKPQLKIVFGGTYMEGIMGKAFIHAFPWVDVVVRGEGERVVPPLFLQLCSGKQAPVPPLPGLCVREGQQVIIHPESPETKAILKEGPVPDYDEYFERIANTDLSDPGIVKVSAETSRGCWWFKHKCKFCGRSAESLRYRTKQLRQVSHELRTLSQKHRQLNFMMVDPCIHAKFMTKLLQGLKEEGMDFKLWCQGRVEFKKDELETLANSGLNTIFVGIESLSTPVLKLMRKGHTALEAVRLLKWAMEYGITITWNMIYGFPGEKPEYYEQMSDLMKSLTHLSPPFPMTHLDLCRSSAYFDEAEQYGIQLLDPDPWQDPLYHLALQMDNGKRIRDLAGKLKGQYQQIHQGTVDMCREVLARWREDHVINYGRLWYRRGQGFINIFDYRTNLTPQVYTLGDLEGKIYLACDSAVSVELVWKDLEPEEKSQVSRDEVKEFLDQLVENRLAYKEDGLYLSLAVSHRGMMGIRGKMETVE
jgi:ribosomal peptide maturation radical SAM protein 1